MDNLESGKKNLTPVTIANPMDAWPYKVGITAYRALLSTFFTLGGFYWLNKRYTEGLEERRGRITEGVKGGIWIHAVSVGEVQSALPLIKLIKEDGSLPCVLSTVTQTGRSMAEQIIGSVADRMIYNPWDAPGYVRRALDTIAPKAYVTVETEIWPGMLYELKKRGIPAFMANGRLSEKSFNRLKPLSALWSGVLSCFERIMVRFDEDKERFIQLGVDSKKIIVTGNCKVDSLNIRKKDAKPQRWSKLRRKGAPLFVAGSTHKGEDDVIMEAFSKVRKKYRDARLIVVPRHPEKALIAVAAALPFNFEVDLFSRIEKKTVNWDVAVVDQIGVLLDIYSAADAAFVGGSLVPKGGQNLMESALFGIQTTHGPEMSDFPDSIIMDRLGAAIQVSNSQELTQCWLKAMDESEKARAKKACDEYFSTLGGASALTWREIKGFL